MLFIGIDPGSSGGIATINTLTKTAAAIAMPETERDVWLLFDGIRAAHAGACFAYIERVHSSPQMGVVSAFKFGRNVGVVYMALVCAGIPFEDITPQSWQKAMGCTQPKRVEFGKKDKNITKRRAQALFPEMTITHAKADALLIAEFCRRQHGGKVTPIPVTKGLFDGEEDEGKVGVGVWDEDHEEVEAREGAAIRTAEVAAGHGAGAQRSHRKGSARLRRRA